MKCNACAKQFLCEKLNTVNSCPDYKSYRYVKDYGKITKIDFERNFEDELQATKRFKRQNGKRNTTV